MTKILKWVLPFAAIAVMCWFGISHRMTDKSVLLSGIDTAATLEADYEVVKNENDTVDAVFYEQDIKLAKKLDTTYLAKVTEVRNIIQQGYICHEFVHTLTTDSSWTTVHNTYEDVWMECVAIDLDSITVSLRTALNALANNELYKKSAISNIVLRSPLGPHIANPAYIMGRVSAVDAHTEEVMTIDEYFAKIFKGDNTMDIDNINLNGTFKVEKDSIQTM